MRIAHLGSIALKYIVKQDDSRSPLWMTAAESNELKKLYLAIVKALHPDLRPNLSDDRMQLFYNAVEAYKNGDLNGLRIIEALVSGPAVSANKHGCEAQFSYDGKEYSITQEQSGRIAVCEANQEETARCYDTPCEALKHPVGSKRLGDILQDMEMTKRTVYYPGPVLSQRLIKQC